MASRDDPRLDELSRALREEASVNAPGASVIDVDAAIAASRARRRPRQWALGAASLAAVLGLGGVAVAAITPPPILVAAFETAADESAPVAEESDLSSGGGTHREPDAVPSGCGDPVAEQVGNSLGLLLRVEFPAAATIAEGIVMGQVRMINESRETVRLSSDGSPVMTLSQHGVTLWHTRIRGSARVEFELAPGESRLYPAQFEAVICSLESDELPPVAPGDYELSATIDVTPLDGGPVEPVTAHRAGIRLD